ncbi:unnamed protein product, partial [Allacma fusca]
NRSVTPRCGGLSLHDTRRLKQDLIYFTMKLHRGKIPISFLGFLQGGLTSAEPVIKATAFAIALFLQIFTRRKGIRSPIIIFIFWLFVAICSLPEFMRELQRLPLKNVSIGILPSEDTRTHYPGMLSSYRNRIYPQLLRCSDPS